MTQIKKFAWYGSSVAFAALLAVTLLVTGSLSTASAAAATGTPTAGVVGGAAATLAVADTDLTAGEVVIFTIIGGTGTGSFTSGGGQTLACADATTTTTCDKNAAAGTVTVQITGATAGSLLVQYAVYDGVDGAINAGANGSSAIATVTLTNPVGSIVLTKGANTIGASSNTTITATVTDTAGANIAAATNVTFQTTHGTLDEGCNSGSGSQVCVGRVQTDDAGASDDGETAGQAIVRIVGGGLTGTATITVSVGTISTTTTLVLSGSTATITVGSQYDTNSGDAVFNTTTDVATGATPSSTNITNGFRITATLKDSGGNIVGGVTPTIASTTGGVTFNACSASSTTTGISTCVVTAQPATVGLVIPFTVTVAGTPNITASGTWTVGATTTAVVEVNAPDIAPVSVGTITATVKDASGNLIGDGTSVTMVVTGGSLLNSTAKTSNGVATFQYVSPGTAQTANATALVGSITGSDTFSVGAVTPPPAESGSFTGTIAASGVSLVVFDGGTVEALAAAAADAGLVSVSLTVDGKFVVYIVGAPAFVNAAFNAAFADGIAASTPVIVKK